jgi:hypothetical protein
MLADRSIDRVSDTDDNYCQHLANSLAFATDPRVNALTLCAGLLTMLSPTSH